MLNAYGHVLSTGYNGVAAGQPHCNEERWGDGAVLLWPHACKGARARSGQNLDACQAIHAEQNALLQCRDVKTIDACYVTASPCITCTKLLLNTSCQKIFYAEEYPHGDAREMWENAGRSWIHLPTS